MTFSLHLFRKRNGRSQRYPAAGQPLYPPADALRLMLALQTRYNGSRCYAVALDPAQTFDASQMARIVEEQQSLTPALP